MSFDVKEWERKHLVESAASAEKVKIRERGGAARIGEAHGARRQITIIEEGWGSSGYYSREVLSRDGPKVWPAGTHMYLNHPGAQEEVDRPERDLKDLVGVLATDPQMKGSKLVAEATVYEHWGAFINEVAKDIGLSIRAIGEAEQGEADGKTGPIIKELTEGISVDYVTQAGAGGKVGMLLESARANASVEEVALDEARNVLDWLASKIHSHFTHLADDGFGNGYLTRDERIALSAAIGAALDAFNDEVEANAAHLSSRDPFTLPEDTEPVVATEVLRAEELLLAERDISRDKRVSLAKKGQAIPVRNDDGEVVDGRFPMEACGDVTNAARAIGRANAGERDRIKAFIKRVANKLGCDEPFQSEESAQPEAAALLELTQKLLGEPYGIRSRGGQQCVYNTDTGETVPGGCHSTRDDALAHQRALMRNVQDSQRSSGGVKKEAHVAEDKGLSELRESVRQLEERQTTLETERDDEKKKRERAEEALQSERARRVVDEALRAEPEEGENGFPEKLLENEKALERVRETALKGKLPVDEDGKLDKDKLVERAQKAARDEAEYLGLSSKEGKVRGMGRKVQESGNENGSDEDISEDEKNRLIESFKRAGMSEDAAKIAAEGR